MLTLYSFRRCPFAMRVRILLHEKNIPFEIIEEDLSALSDSLKTFHPEAKVPVLIDGKRVLYESAIITEYIEDKFPGKTPLLPKDPGLRAEIRLWTYWCNQLFKPDLDRFKYGTSRFPEKECQGVSEKVKNHLAKLESPLKFSDWLVGGQFTLADIHVFPFFRQLARVKPTPLFLSDYPSLIRWLQRISEMPAVVKTLEK